MKNRIILLISFFFAAFSFGQTPASIQWQKCLGGTSSEYGFKIQQTSDGGYILVGYTDSDDGNVSGNHGLLDIWVVKLDASGILQWQKCLGGSSEEFGLSIEQTTDGGYILVGATASNNGDVSGNNGFADIWVVKLNSTGLLLWQKCYGGTTVTQDIGFSIKQTSDGGYILVGYTDSDDGNVYFWDFTMAEVFRRFFR